MKGEIQTHKSVMLAEVLGIFAPISEGFFLDATLGNGGHAEALLLSHEYLMLVGLDRDAEAIERAELRLARFANRCTLLNTCFDLVGQELDRLEISKLTGALFDLGVSSNHLNDPKRGFSFRLEGPLDMRMDQNQTLTAADVVNDLAEDDLANVLYEYGDERKSRSIASAIVDSRPLKTTLELAKVISKAVAFKHSRQHPARRSFQALRIYVNKELAHIVPALTEVSNRLAPGGRAVVLSYHSGEDGIVKRLLREWETSNPEINLLHRKVKKPTKSEIAENPRAKSARLRSFEKVGG